MKNQETSAVSPEFSGAHLTFNPIMTLASKDNLLNSVYVQDVMVGYKEEGLYSSDAHGLVVKIAMY